MTHLYPLLVSTMAAILGFAAFIVFMVAFLLTLGGIGRIVSHLFGTTTLNQLDVNQVDNHR